MDVLEDIIWWQQNHPTEYGVLANALGEQWLIENVKKCIGVRWNKDYHPLGWKVFSHSEENYSEVILVAKLLSMFSTDREIGTLIRNLKNPEDYHQTLFHLMLAYQFFRAGWSIALENPSLNGKADFMATQSGEVLYVECSEKALLPPPPFNERAFMVLSNKLSNYCSMGMDANIILKTEEVTIHEIEALLDANKELLAKFTKKEIIETTNVSVEIVRRSDKRSAVYQVDKRPRLSLAERLLKKIDDENRQTKTAIATRIVALLLLGNISPEVWAATMDEMGRRLPGKKSKPDSVFFFQKKWVEGQCRLRLLGYIPTTSKGEAEIFGPTLDFMEEQDSLI
ncbi:MAG: hypothetical protein KBA40_00915 [Candidatus Peribacteraceae bacterium]|nr:hypothetical protein [Candidatus Peribacteraceae bacterium]MBP9850357.1 hypothetical protein [Candidatus Peribacteraceae bacterium]